MKKKEGVNFDSSQFWPSKQIITPASLYRYLYDIQVPGWGSKCGLREYITSERADICLLCCNNRIYLFYIFFHFHFCRESASSNPNQSGATGSSLYLFHFRLHLAHYFSNNIINTVVFSSYFDPYKSF